MEDVFEGMIKLKWHGTVPDDIDVLELTVIEDIRKSLTSLDRPSELIFHNVFVGDTIDDEIVSVWGVEGDDEHFHCEYISEPTWVSLKELEEDKNGKSE